MSDKLQEYRLLSTDYVISTIGKGDRVKRGLGTSFVMNLTDKIRNNNHHVYFDNILPL